MCTRRRQRIVAQSGLPNAAVLPPNVLAVPNPPVTLLFMPPKPPPKPPRAAGGSWTAPTRPPPECRNLQEKTKKHGFTVQARRDTARRPAQRVAGAAAARACSGRCARRGLSQPASQPASSALYRQLAANRHEYRLPSFQSLHGLLSLGSFLPLPPRPRPPPRRLIFQAQSRDSLMKEGPNRVTTLHVPRF